MLINPDDLSGNLDRLEEIENVSLRLVTQAILYQVAFKMLLHASKSPLPPFRKGGCSLGAPVGFPPFSKGGQGGF
jgi:hypothetical protein